MHLTHSNQPEVLCSTQQLHKLTTRRKRQHRVPTWGLHHVDIGFTVRVDRVSEVEPAVINILLLAVRQGVGLAGLRQLVPALHARHVEVHTLLGARLLLLALIESSALNTVPGQEQNRNRAFGCVHGRFLAFNLKKG